MRDWFHLSKLNRQDAAPAADWKQAAIADFTQWLDELEEPPADIADGEEENRYGLVDLVDAMTALRTETGNLARNAARALRDGEEWQKSFADEREREAAVRAEERQELKRAAEAVQGLSRLQDAERERSERRRVLQMLFDTVEDLRAVRERCSAAVPRGWFKRSAAQPAVEKELALLIKGIEASLESCNVRGLVAVGDPFDPRTMRAIAAVETGRVPRGAVCDVIRQGIIIDEQLERYAEVNVEKEMA